MEVARTLQALRPGASPTASSSRPARSGPSPGSAATPTCCRGSGTGSSSPGSAVPGPSSTSAPRRGVRDIDRAAAHVVARRGGEVRGYSPYGYDERQFNAIGFDLPFGRLSRTPHGEYPEYHTSADDLSFVKPPELAESYLAVARAPRRPGERRGLPQPAAPTASRSWASGGSTRARAGSRRPTWSWRCCGCSPTAMGRRHCSTSHRSPAATSQVCAAPPPPSSPPACWAAHRRVAVRSPVARWRRPTADGPRLLTSSGGQHVQSPSPVDRPSATPSGRDCLDNCGGARLVAAAAEFLAHRYRIWRPPGNQPPAIPS